MAAKSEVRDIPGPDSDMTAKENLDRELSRLLEELSGLLKRPSPLAGLFGEERGKANAEVRALFERIGRELEELRGLLWPKAERSTGMKEPPGQEEQYCALYRKDSSETLDQPGDEVYCCDCFEEIEYFSGPIKIIDKAEFEPLKVSELPSREVRCTRCQEMISGKRAGKLEGFWEAKEE